MEAMTGRTPSILNVGEFGCDAFVHQDNTQRDTTFSPKALPGVYLGHDARQNCAVVRMLATGKTIRSKDVDLREGSFKHMRALRHGRESEVPSVEYDDDILLAGDHQSLRDSSSPPALSAAALSEKKEEIDVALDSARDDSDDENEDDMEYEVEAITGERHSRDRFQYRVQWKGYPKATWEPAQALKDTAALDTWEKQKVSAKPTRVLRSNYNSSQRSKEILSGPTQSDSDEDGAMSADSVAAATNAAANRL
jgi:hypothetical protein